jgi:shikimate dehydrogenase
LIDLDALGLGPEALGELLTAAERMGFRGLNITYPCKQAVLPLLHELSPDARALGAVNTVVLRGRRRIGHNTDCSGFAEGFRRGLPQARRERVVQLGAGGAGAAVAHALLSEGVGTLAVSDTDAARAEALAAELLAPLRCRPRGGLRRSRRRTRCGGRAGELHAGRHDQAARPAPARRAAAR